MAIKLTEEIVEIIDDSLENVPINLSHKKAFLSETKHDRFDSRWAGRQRDILPKKYKKILASLVGKTEKEVRDKLLLSGDKGATIESTMLDNIYDYYFCIYNEGYLVTDGFRVHIDEYHNKLILYYFINGILHSTRNVKKSTVKRDTTEYSNIYEVKDNFVTFIISNKYEWGKQLFRKVKLEKGSTNYVYPTYTTDEAYSVKNKILHSHNEREAYIHVNNNMKRINKKANFDMIGIFGYIYSYSSAKEHNHTISYNGNFYLGRLTKQDWLCPNTTIPMTTKEAEKAMSHLKDFISTK